MRTKDILLLGGAAALLYFLSKQTAATPKPGQPGTPGYYVQSVYKIGSAAYNLGNRLFG